MSESTPIVCRLLLQPLGLDGVEGTHGEAPEVTSPASLWYDRTRPLQRLHSMPCESIWSAVLVGGAGGSFDGKCEGVEGGGCRDQG